MSAANDRGVLAVPHPMLGIADAREQRAAWIRANSKPSARKSYGSYKPLIVKSDGRTEVVGVRAETRYREWIDGKPNPRTAYTKYERGQTFSDRVEAVDYAAKVIDRRVADELSAASEIRGKVAALARAGGAA